MPKKDSSAKSPIQLGWDARLRNASIASNPFTDPVDREAWRAGFIAASGHVEAPKHSLLTYIGGKCEECGEECRTFRHMVMGEMGANSGAYCPTCCPMCKVREADNA